MDFQRRKLALCLWILGLGMLAALGWDGWQEGVVHARYPYNTFLYTPEARFSDFSDSLYMACLPNPYDDPNAFYLPLAWVGLRGLAPWPCTVTWAAFLFICLGGLINLLFLALRKVLVHPGKRLGVAFLLVALSYPVAICVDRGNIEILLVLLVAATLYFYHRARYAPAAVCLVVAISLKLYPALLLVLFWRQRKLRLIGLMALAVIVLSLLSLVDLGLPLSETWRLYRADMAFFIQRDVYENYTLEGSAALWNTYKVGLLKAADWGLIPPVDFSFDGRFIAASYTVYTAFMLAVLLVLVLHASIIEKEASRCAILLLLFLSISTPNGADYRLLFVCLALALHVLLKTRRPCDLGVLLLLALVLVPKKEFYIDYVGQSDGGGDQVSLQVVLNPLFIFGAISCLRRDAWLLYDTRWSRRRLGLLLRGLGKKWNFPQSGTVPPQVR